MDLDLVRQTIEANGEFTFSRSSGPGGQNVNKVNTKTLLRIPLASIDGISDLERERLRTQLQSRLTAEGDLQIQVQDERSQWLNRELAVERLALLIAGALHRDKPRRRTKPTRASQERRLTAKKVTSAHKRNRLVRDE